MFRYLLFAIEGATIIAAPEGADLRDTLRRDFELDLSPEDQALQGDALAAALDADVGDAIQRGVGVVVAIATDEVMAFYTYSRILGRGHEAAYEAWLRHMPASEAVAAWMAGEDDTQASDTDASEDVPCMAPPSDDGPSHEAA
jgi:hypothetical protein